MLIPMGFIVIYLCGSKNTFFPQRLILWQAGVWISEWKSEQITIDIKRKEIIYIG